MAECGEDGGVVAPARGTHFAENEALLVFADEVGYVVRRRREALDSGALERRREGGVAGVHRVRRRRGEGGWWRRGARSACCRIRVWRCAPRERTTLGDDDDDSVAGLVSQATASALTSTDVGAVVEGHSDGRVGAWLSYRLQDTPRQARQGQAGRGGHAHRPLEEANHQTASQPSMSRSHVHAGRILGPALMRPSGPWTAAAEAAMGRGRRATGATRWGFVPRTQHLLRTGTEQTHRPPEPHMHTHAQGSNDGTTKQKDSTASTVKGWRRD